MDLKFAKYMSGFLLIAPTGSGKSTTRERNLAFASKSTDGDSLIDWSRCRGVRDWRVPDREHLNTVLDHMRATNRCVCWYVGTTAIADALDEGRLDPDDVAIVVLPEDDHRRRVEARRKPDHGWDRATEHRALCEGLIAQYALRKFTSLEASIDHITSKLAGGRPHEMRETKEPNKA